MCKKVVSSVFVLLILIFFTSCQPTPESSLIVNKTDDAINSLIEKPAQGPVITDGHITESITLVGGRVIANVDAEIKSKYDYYGVYEIERKTITQAQVDKAVELLYGDRQIWDYTGQETDRDSYIGLINFYEITLTDIKNNRQKYEELVKDPNNTYDSVDEWIKSLEDAIEECKEEMKTAPTEEELRKNVHRNLRYSETDNDVKYVMLSADMGRSKQSLFNVVVPDDINSLETKVSLTYDDAAASSDDIQTTDTITAEEALELAERFALAMDENFVLISNELRVSQQEDYSNSYYQFEFCIAIDGMPISKSRKMSDYENSFGCGSMLITVDDLGINHISWYEPIKVTKKLNERVQMIPAEQAYETFIKYFKLKYASDSIYVELHDKKIFDIYEISVAYVIEPIKDRPNVARVMPCWNFVCKQTTKLLDGSPDIVSERMSLYAINALDGSIIR